MSRGPIRAILLLLCGTLAWAPFGCANRSSSSAPRPDPNLAASSPAPPREPGASAPATASYGSSAQSQRWSDSMRKGREDLRLGRLEAAEDSFLSALQATRSMRPSDVRVGVTLSNLERLAASYHAARRGEDFTRVAKIVASESPPGSDSPELAALLTQLGRLQLKREETDEAAASFKRALEMRVRLEGPEAKSVVVLYGQLSRVEIARKNLDSAALYIERAIEIQETSGRTETPVFVAGLVDLGQLRSDQGRGDEAIALLRRALEISRKLELPRTEQIQAQLVALQNKDPWEPN